jgi:hypothetical protein
MVAAKVTDLIGGLPPPPPAAPGVRRALDEADHRRVGAA